jgi:hypothetical protein
LAAGKARPAARSAADSPQANAKRAFCSDPVINQEVKIFQVPRPAASFARQTPASPGLCREAGMPGAV